MRLTKVQLGRAITVLGLQGTRDFITFADAVIEDEGTRVVLTTAEGTTIVPIQNVLYMNPAAQVKVAPAKENSVSKTDEEVEQATAEPAGRPGRTAKRTK